MNHSLPIAPDKPWLAPLAGYSDLPFRLLCRTWGCNAACTEMISAKGLFYSSENTMDLLRTCSSDFPLIVQVYGSELNSISKAMDRLLEMGFKYFDLNCGCSVRKVTKTGSGAALLRNPSLLVDMIAVMAEKAGRNNVGVKMRIGWNNDQPVYLDLAEPLAGAGAGWITLHPRTAVQMFSGRADWQALKKLKEVSKVPVVASGDLYTAEDALNCVKQTGVDTVMFARGALMDPAIAMRYLNLLQERADLPRNKLFVHQLCMQTIAHYRRFSSSPRTALKLRSLLPRIIRSLPGARDLRQRIIKCKDWKEMEEALLVLQGR